MGKIFNFKIVNVVLIIFPIYSFSQSLDWLNIPTFQNDAITKDINIDQQGNILQLIHNNLSGSSITIRKLNDSGYELWTKNLNVGTISSIDTDSSGNIFLLGNSSGQDLNPDPNVNNSFFSNAGMALFVLKLNPDGNFIKFSTIGEYPGLNANDGSSIYTTPKQIKVDNNGNILFSSRISGGGFIDIDPSENISYLCGWGNVLIKWSNDLDSLIFCKGIYSLSDWSSDYSAVFFDIDSENNIYSASIVYDKICLSKYSQNGILLNEPWNTLIEGFGQNYISDLHITSSNKIVLSGQFINNIDLNPLEDGANQSLNSNYPYLYNGQYYLQSSFLAQYDTNFNLEWKHLIDSESVDKIEDTESNDEYIFVCGLYEDTTPGGGYFYWFNCLAYLKIFDLEGNLIKTNKYISPFPEDPDIESDFGTARPFVQNSFSSYPTQAWTFYWGNRNIKFLNNDSFIIAGEYSDNLVDNFPLYSNGFDWNNCPPPYGYGDQYYSSENPYIISQNNYLKPYLSKYSTNQIFSEQEIILCSNDSVIIGSNIYNEEGIFVDTLITNTCVDSIIMSSIYVLNSNITYDTIISQNAIEWNGNYYNQSGDYSQILTNVYGCDSLIYLNFTIISQSFNCENYECIDPMDGSGIYSSLTDCEQVCQKVSTIEEEYFKYKVYPNPSRGEFNISLDLESRQDVNLSITNYLGEVIFTEELKEQEGQYNKTIDLGNKANGIYMLNITTNNQNINQKIVIQ